MLGRCCLRFGIGLITDCVKPMTQKHSLQLSFRGNRWEESREFYQPTRESQVSFRLVYIYGQLGTSNSSDKRETGARSLAE